MMARKSIKASIPVDVSNPGQVFACLGFMEAARILCGQARGGFDWTNAADTRFTLAADGDRNPFATVLEFLAGAHPNPVIPKNRQAAAKTPKASSLELSSTYPTGKDERMARPIRLHNGERPSIQLGCWADGSSREAFKLYSGNRSAEEIAGAMLHGNSSRGTKGVAQLWQEDSTQLTSKPFDVVTPMGGSFNLDPRGAWTAIDAGYSPNEHKHPVQASPVVEFLAAWGLDHARPDETRKRQFCYAVWDGALPPPLARVALTGILEIFPTRRFSFELAMSGKNKVVTFAEEEV
ncbi:MAG: type I-U CRISPR-associated protein Cas8c [Rhodobacteraceae bacterium]|nr:type I-U CRISPR-associated protein Cas8c [Paracoccaceae bacterium]